MSEYVFVWEKGREGGREGERERGREKEGGAGKSVE